MIAVETPPQGGTPPPKLQGRSLTLVLPGAITRDGATYRAFLPYARLANDLTRYFGRVIVSTQVVPAGFEGADANDGVFNPNVEVQGLPVPPKSGHGVVRNVLYQFRRGSSLLRFMRTWDLVYVFIPSYPGAIAYTANRFLNRRPVAVYLANDWEEITSYIFRWGGWRRKLLFPLYHGLLTRWERWIAATSPLTITAGRALLRKFSGEGGPIFETVPLLEMRPADIFERVDTFQGQSARLLFIGTLHPRKGLPVLFKALETLRRERREFTLDIVGDGPLEYRRILDEEVARRGLEGRVRFHGFVPNGPGLYHFYRQADAFILPTYSEGFPRVLYEALGQSLPVVASAVSGIPHLLENSRHALLVPPGDDDALAEAMTRLFVDSALRRRLINEGLELVRPIIARDAAEQFVDLCREYLLTDSHS